MEGSMLQIADAVAQNPWKFCLLCGTRVTFLSPNEFKRHLRMNHSTQEGGSFVCKYGRNNVCPSLPIDGVNQDDYENHVEKCHIGLNGRIANSESTVHSKKLSIAAAAPTPSSPFIKYKDDNLEALGMKSWTQHPCQNLSAVLNDPRKLTRQPDFFTRIWGEDFIPQPVVPLTLLPNTPRSLFTDHLKRYEIKCMTHEKLKRTNLAPHSGRKSSTRRKQHANLQTEESDLIPEVFLKSNFKLEEPDTFNKVFPWSNFQQTNRDAQKNSGKLLQEKLTHYLDVAEVNLAQQIATKSEDFFNAMRSQESLQSEVKNSCSEVQTLRTKLLKIRTCLIEEPLNVMRLIRLRQRYEVVEEKLKLMTFIHQTQPTIQLLLATADFVSALDLIDTSLEVLQQELAGLQCFRHLGSQLTEMQKVIERMMATDFLDFAVTILNQPYAEDVKPLEEEKLLAVVLGLLRQKKSDFLSLYKAEAFSIIKKSIKQAAHDAMPEDVEVEVSEEQSAKFGDFIRSLDHNEWLMVLEAVFCVVLQILKNMRVIHDGLVSVFALAAGIKKEHVLSQNNEPSNDNEYMLVEDNMNAFLDESDCEKLTKESKDLLCKACELAQSRCSKIIIMRSKDGSLDRLSSKDFVTLARIVERFALDCEGVSGRQSHNLRGTLLTQAKRFIERFHSERLHKLSNILDNERWKQVDVPAEMQEIVDSFNEGMDKTINSQSSTTSDTATAMNTMLIVQGQEFAVVGTLLILMKIIAEYCQCIDDVPMLVTDVMTRLCELLKIFNSRACQLVLGAGALQTVGLKTITAKHLMLVAQCLQVVILNINTIKNHFELRLTPKQYVMLTQFDQILKDYNNHRHELLCKITNLMEEIFNSYLSQYELKPPMPSKTMRNIVAQVKKLCETMAAILSEQQLEVLFRDVRRKFKDCLASKLADFGVSNDGGPQHGF
uniref:Vacuolar protein sorting-associated protein 54 n=1 Tax=Clytia hemisphaerica TaxID=252671 RepID=A0A7M5WYY1_9CNID